MNKHLKDYILKYPQALLKRHTYIDLFTETDRVEVTKVKDDYILEIASKPFIGMLVVYDGYFYAISNLEMIESSPDFQTFKVELDPVELKSTTDVLCKTTDEIELHKGDILNFKDAEPIVTNLGRYIVNYVLLVDPFGDRIPYMNVTFKGAKLLEKAISDGILTNIISPFQERIYGANLLFLSSNPEYFSPTITSKVLTTGDNVRALKLKLLEENKEAIANGDIVTIANLEKQVVDEDKKYCKGDPSKIFLMKDSYFSNIRKKLFGIHGAIPAFGKPGEYDFIPNSLEEGWTVDSFPKIANEIRDGTNARAKEVAKGGEESNFILRIFQNTRITESDCGTKHGRVLKLTKDNYKEYIGRNILLNGKTVELTSLNIVKFIDKEVTIRSPMYCKASNGGICYKCMSKTFEETSQDSLATIMNALGAMFSTLALKKVHNTAVSSAQLKDLDEYIL